MSYQYFAEQLKPSDDREQLLYYAGMFEAFQDIISASYAGNQPGFKDSAVNPGQFIGFVIYSETSRMPDDGLYIEIYPDGTVLVKDRTSYTVPGSNEPTVDIEEHFTLVQNILNWLRAQPPKIQAYL